MNRSVAQLVLAQAILMSVSSLMVTSAAIIGAHLADNPALASLPLAVQFVAVMGTTIPASLLMRAIGRRAGFLLASLIGIAGASCAAGALLHWLSWRLVNYAALPVLGFALFAQFRLWSSKRSKLSPSHP